MDRGVSSGAQPGLLLCGRRGAEWGSGGFTKSLSRTKGTKGSSKGKGKETDYSGPCRETERGGVTTSSAGPSDLRVAEGPTASSGADSSTGHFTTSSPKPGSSVGASSELCKANGKPTKDKTSSAGEQGELLSINYSDTHFDRDGGRRGGGNKSPCREHDSPCGPSTIKGHHEPCEPTTTRWRSIARWATDRLRFLTGIKGCSRQGEIATRISKQIRELFPDGLPECLQTSEASPEDANVSAGSSVHGPVNGNLLRTIRRLRQLSRIRDDSVLLSPHLRLRSQRGHGGGERTSGLDNDGSGTGSSRQWQMGLGLPADPPRGTASSVVELPPFGDTEPIEGLCPTLCTEMGDSGLGLCEGGGLYPEQETRAEQAKAATIRSFASEPKAEAEEKAKVSRRRRRKLKQQSRARSLKNIHVAVLGDPSPSSSTSARLRFPETAIFGRGEPLARATKDGSKDDDDVMPTSSVDKDCEAQQELQGRPKCKLWSEFNFETAFPENLKQEGVPICAWVEIQVRRILASRTTYSLYLLRSITLCREGRDDILSTALFPIPFAFEGIWQGDLKKMNSTARSLKAMRKMLHVAIMALNFLHERSPLGLLRRRPSQTHRQVYTRLMTLIKACVLPGKATVAKCGRKSHQFDARLKELFEVLRQHGLTEKSKYHQSRSGTAVPMKNDQADELRPYRALDASRLKLSGKGHWRCEDFLNDLLYMPFMEPRFNEHDLLPPKEVCPDVTKEDPKEAEALARVWDVNGLLRLIPVELAPDHVSLFTRAFNNFKSELQDRQIGDRRGQNYIEGQLKGCKHTPSHFLPTGSSLLQIMPRRFDQGLRGYVTDRRDFYHQFATTWERSATNVIYPLMRLSGFKDTKAYEEFLDRFSKKRKADREEHGDFLHGQRKTILCDENTTVAAAFGAIFQGDHIGVEVACSAHESLLAQVGLLQATSRLVSGSPLAYDDATDGLVIDDYFVISKFDIRHGGEPGLGKEMLERAKRIYAHEGIIGPDDKDIWGDKKFKVVGAEIDSRDELVRQGAVLCGAPAAKRLVLASIAALSSSWPYTSDALHSSLVGSIVSAMMFRRPMMSVLHQVFHVIPPTELNTEEPAKICRSGACNMCFTCSITM